jgi:8-oxo-dGTP pyrophosphatase MutT (NUDIX family)
MYIGAGLILINSRGDVLLVRDTRSNRLGFPKGHPEKKDKDIPLNTAIRECWEETGLILNNDYKLDGNKPKRIGKRLYFSGICWREAFHAANVNKKEISEIGWWSLGHLGEALETQLNSDLRCWLKKLKFISSPAPVASAVAATS